MMRYFNRGKYIALLCLAAFLPEAAWAAMTVTDVVNYGSRTGSGLPGAGIAQGALFAVIGSGIGPDQPIQATFPLPTTDGLGGVTISIAAGGTTVNAIMVYASANEVDAILPSSTPPGPATVTVNNGGATATASITVVPAAFGIFTGAGAYNVAADGTVAANTPYQSAQPGQTVMINGTGLGAIASDETQSGATDVPNASITVWVGAAQATVVSAGRGACCTGIDPNFPIPQGIAAWDVISFTVPDGAQGCQVSVAVQIGNVVSNLSHIAVAPGGGTCPEATPFNGGTPVVLSGKVKTGSISVLRTQISQNSPAGSVNIISDAASAAFYLVDFGPNPVPIPSYSSLLQASAGSCTVSVSRFDRSVPVTPPTVTLTPLDAGAALNITAPKVSQAMKKDNNGIYSASASVTSISVPGVPPIVTGGTDFVVPGSYTLDNGSGGADIGPFSSTLRNPTPVNWDNMSQVSPVNRAQGVTVKWSGGDPDGTLAITGSSSSIQGNLIYSGFFVCYAPVSAGQFTVPPFVTLQLPASGAQPQAGSGSMSLSATITGLVNIPGTDAAYYFSQTGGGTSVLYQ